MDGYQVVSLAVEKGIKGYLPCVRKSVYYAPKQLKCGNLMLFLQQSLVGLVCPSEKRVQLIRKHDNARNNLAMQNALF
jgi:hypothetical protein